MLISMDLIKVYFPENKKNHVMNCRLQMQHRNAIRGPERPSRFIGSHLFCDPNEYDNVEL
jgi:hypothetical protein